MTLEDEMLVAEELKLTAIEELDTEFCADDWLESEDTELVFVEAALLRTTSSPEPPQP